MRRVGKSAMSLSRLPMGTPLLLAGNHPASDLLARFVPPPCRPASLPSLDWRRRGDVLEFDLELELGSKPAFGDVEILPSFSAVSDCSYSFQFSLAWMAATGDTRTIALSPVGAAGPFLEPGSDAGLSVRSQIDYFAVTDDLAGAHLIVQAFSENLSELAGAPCLLAVSVRSAGAATGPSDGPDRTAAKTDIPVPALSQMVDSQLGPRLCSPTSVTMVVSHYGFPVQLLEVAEMAYHPAQDLYGVWPAALYAASRHHLIGYLLWFPDWEAARWLLDRGIPVVASLRYNEGELAGAAVSGTGGHLVVLRGYDADSVLVNDPAADRADDVTRSYPLNQFLSAWLQGSGVGYVLFPGID